MAFFVIGVGAPQSMYCFTATSLGYDAKGSHIVFERIGYEFDWYVAV